MPKLKLFGKSVEKFGEKILNILNLPESYQTLFFADLRNDYLVVLLDTITQDNIKIVRINKTNLSVKVNINFNLNDVFDFGFLYGHYDISENGDFVIPSWNTQIIYVFLWNEQNNTYDIIPLSDIFGYTFFAGNFFINDKLIIITKSVFIYQLPNMNLIAEILPYTNPNWLRPALIGNNLYVGDIYNIYKINLLDFSVETFPNPSFVRTPLILENPLRVVYTDFFFNPLRIYETNLETNTTITKLTFTPERINDMFNSGIGGDLFPIHEKRKLIIPLYYEPPSYSYGFITLYMYDYDTNTIRKIPFSSVTLPLNIEISEDGKFLIINDLGYTNANMRIVNLENEKVETMNNRFTPILAHKKILKRLG